MNTLIGHAETDPVILRCFPVMAQLRPHLHESDFVERVKRQQQQGYRLAYLEGGGQIRALAGYRFLEFLAWGRVCYLDDLITDSESRSRGFAGALFDWVIARAREAGCDQFHLDSGFQRFDAHRFYLAHRMAISCHHFSMPLASPATRLDSPTR